MTEAALFVGGRVYTGRRYVEALAVEDGRVLAAGTEADARRALSAGADRVDLAGGLLVPGLADAHLHLAELARSRQTFDARAAPSVADLLRSLAQWASGTDAPVVVGKGLDLDRLAERRWPLPDELQAAAGDRPAILYHVSGHAAVVSSRFPETGAPSRQHAEPLDRAPGVLLEDELHTVQPTVDTALPLTREAICAALRDLVSEGLVAVGTMSARPSELALLSDLAGAGELPLHVRAYPPMAERDAWAAPAARGRRGRFAIVGAKTYLDGAFGPRTAALEAPYADEPTTQGIDRQDDGELLDTLRELRQRDLVPAIHAIGDRAVARAVRLLATLGDGATPARIEHASLTPPELLGPLARLRARLVVQPGFLLSDLWLADRLGADRARSAYVFRTLADHGVPLAGSSDAPFDPPDPWRGLRAATERRDDLGRSANARPDQRLGFEEALGIYTSGARAAVGDVTNGTLEAGASADLVLVAGRSLAEAFRQGAAGVRRTWVEGQPVGTGPRAAGGSA